MIRDILQVVQIILSLMLIFMVVLQSKGTGIGSTFGGDMGFYGTKRGAEKMLFISTIVISVVLMLSLIVGIFL